MKLLLLLSFFVLIATTGITQINKGQFLIGGNVSFESIKNDGNNIGYKTTNVFVSPNVGYFIINNLASGIRLDFRSYKQKAPNNFTQTYTSISPFLRYYFLPTTKKLNAFIDVSYINYTSKFRNSLGSSFNEKTNGYAISAGPSIFLTPQVALEFTVGYKRTIGKDTYYSKSTMINSGLGLQIHFRNAKIRSKK